MVAHKTPGKRLVRKRGTRVPRLLYFIMTFLMLLCITELCRNFSFFEMTKNILLYICSSLFGVQGKEVLIILLVDNVNKAV